MQISEMRLDMRTAFHAHFRGSCALDGPCLQHQRVIHASCRLVARGQLRPSPSLTWHLRAFEDHFKESLVVLSGYNVLQQVMEPACGLCTVSPHLVSP